MEKWLLYFLRPIAFFISLFFNSKLKRVFTLFGNLIHSFYLKREFFKTGKNFSIEAPAVIHGAKYITVGENFSAFARLRLEAFDKHLSHSFQPNIVIGNNVSINYDCHIGCINQVSIGDNVLIASKVFITDHLHGKTDLFSLNLPPSFRPLHSKGPVIIKQNVWIGEGVVILPNVTIGENAIIGGNSVVTKSFPANSVVGGVPAKIIKEIK